MLTCVCLNIFQTSTLTMEPEREFSEILQLDSQRGGQVATHLPGNLQHLPSTIKKNAVMTSVLALPLAWLCHLEAVT